VLQGKRREGSDQAVFYHSFVSGCVAGCTASFLVTPMDGEHLFDPLILTGLCLHAEPFIVVQWMVSIILFDTSVLIGLCLHAEPFIVIRH
jgi:hypothetical protein